MKQRLKKRLILTFGLITIAFQHVSAQNDQRIISTAVPFLLLVPDARSSAMGNAATASSNDANTIYWNASIMPLIENQKNLSLSYTPWFGTRNTDVYSLFGSATTNIDERNAIGLSLKYFSAGKQDYTDEFANYIQEVHPKEFAIDVAYAKRMSTSLSIGATLQFIYSGLYYAQDDNVGISAGTALACNISATYIAQAKNHSFKSALVISNIGEKISYFQNGQREFLPTNIRVGFSDIYKVNDLMMLTIAMDARKLLLPTPPTRDSNDVINKGRDPNRSVTSAIFNSFSDAPGGLREELNEISTSIGLELLLANQFAIRAGYNSEHPSKGGQSYLASGLGMCFGKSELSLSYLFANRNIRSFSNYLRISISHNLGIDGRVKKYWR